MRDPQRIPEVLEELRKVWEANPDLRLTQLIVNALEARPNAIFGVEDDVLLSKLRGEPVEVKLAHAPMNPKVWETVAELERESEVACRIASMNGPKYQKFYEGRASAFKQVAATLPKSLKQE